MSAITPSRTPSEEIYEEDKMVGSEPQPDKFAKIDPESHHIQDDTLAALDTVQEEVCFYNWKV